MSQRNKAFEFDEFLLDTDERVLYRDAQPLAITPKTFQLLQVLVERRGRIVEREELFQAVWGDTIVEEGNLAFTIRLLRKALGDDRSNPKYIETVPRRGYRFVGEVRELNDFKRLSVAEPSIREARIGAVDPISSAAAKGFAIGAVAMLVALVGTVTFWLGRQTSSDGSDPAKRYRIQQLSTDGVTSGAVISPDGKNIVYRSGLADGRENVWFRQLETGNNVELIPASNDVYFKFAFSPDGNFVYFTRRAKSLEGQADIFRIPIFGGIPRKIASETQGWISVSSDGRLVSFVRCYYREDENCSLWIANAERGGEERRLVNRSSPLRISANAIAPDGKSVAFAVGQTANSANDFELRSVDITTGEERLLTREKFFNINSISWRPDDGGALISARKADDALFRICLVARDGEMTVLTRDATDYSSVSIDREGARVVAASDSADFKLRVFPLARSAAGRVLTDALTGSFGHDGSIAFSSFMSGNAEIWITDPSGGARSQLTTERSIESYPLFSRDGRWIYFGTNRSGDLQIFRMRPDGADQSQVSFGPGGYPSFASHDGRWLYYMSARDRTLWRVATDGTRAEEQVMAVRSAFYSASAANDKVVHSSSIDGPTDLVIALINDGRRLQTLRNGSPNSHIVSARWTPDDSAIIYLTSDLDGGPSRVWKQNLDGSAPTMMVELSDEAHLWFDLAADGLTFLTVSGRWKRDAILVTGLL